MTLCSRLAAAALVVALAGAPLPARAPQAAAPSSADHALGLSGAPNFRDFGGYRTTNGHVVRRHILYRSSALASLTPVDWIKVQGLGIKGVYDLRTVSERQSKPDGWPHPPATVYGSPKPDLSGLFGDIRAAGNSPAKARAAFIRFYTAAPFAYAGEYAAIFHALAQGQAPVLIHCTAGKDRTGVAAALLLEALHVPRATILADYAMTETLTPPPPAHPPMGNTSAAAPAMPPAVARMLGRADPAYVEASLQAVRRRYGSIDAYMRGALHMTPVEIASLRHNLLS
jgi:protein-tyrosine phosphatase